MDQLYLGSKKRKKYTDSGRTIKKKGDTKVLALGIIQRKGRVYTHVITRADRRTLTPIIHMVVKRGTKIYTDGWTGYNKLLKSGYKHYTVNHSKSFTNGKGVHIQNIESFWAFVKMRLGKFKGLSRETLILHLKECEFRFNNKKNLQKAVENVLTYRDNYV